jgi:hypothetical protein
MKPFSLYLLARTLPRLGFSPVLKVAIYRLKKKLGLLRLALPVGAAYDGPFLPGIDGASPTPPDFEHHVFSRKSITLPPVAGWHSNCLTGQVISGPERHWTEIPDFDPAVGDIKLVWESSRFDWLPRHALRLRNDREGRAALDALIVDWVRHAPVNAGPNWKCGQESGLRLLNFLLARHILGESGSAEPAACRFVAEHLVRIMHSIDYAVGQDNNHATSEAAALYIGGLWLERRGSAGQHELARRAKKIGRRLNESMALRLFMPDGTFSQHSVVYHRMALSILALVDLFRRHWGEVDFGEAYKARMIAATQWLSIMTCPLTGDAPNFGANDGTLLFNLSNAPYRDFRPAVALAEGVFCNRHLYGGNPLLEVFGVVPQKSGLNSPCLFHGLDGGILACRDGGFLVMLRVPRYRFRPCHADGLHLDLWVGGKNLLRDGGSYSYADLSRHLHYSSTECHNTVTFDGQDQMPRIGRFLFALWQNEPVPAPITEPDGGIILSACSQSFRGGRHVRTVRIASDRRSIQVSDQIENLGKEAVLRWRTAEVAEDRGEGVFCTQSLDVKTECNSCITTEIKPGVESLHYLEETPLSVMTISIPGSGHVETSFKLKA